ALGSIQKISATMIDRLEHSDAEPESLPPIAGGSDDPPVPSLPHVLREPPSLYSDSSLSPQMQEWLAGEQAACLLAATETGASFVVKLPSQQIERLRGPVPMAVQHELYLHPQAPVLRTLTVFYDDPTHPFL